MQTVGKTTNKMDFPLPLTDILLNSISGKTNYTIDVKIGTKRISTDNHDLKENPKKRRKQSNPTRISSNEEKINFGSDTELLSSDEGKNGLIYNEENLKLTPHQYNSSSLPLNLTKSENQELSSNDLRKIKLSYHNQQQNESFTENLKNLSSSHLASTKTIQYFGNKQNCSTESSDCMVSFKNQPCSSSSSTGLTSVQIFNPEAFCDQCNKEFCNKYFLKTHKANKHGVFIDSYPNSSIIDQLDRNKMSSLPMTSDISTNTNDISTGASVPLLFKNPAMCSQSLGNTNTCLQKNFINNPTRAFCSICQKEFCNKYFVKRHKAKIHGIVDDEDYKITVDDVPLNFKTNLKIKNEVVDDGISDTYSKDEKIVSLTFQTRESTMAVSKTLNKLVIKDTIKSVENHEPFKKPVIIDPKYDNIKVEYQDVDQNVSLINKLSNEKFNVNNCNINELTSNSPHTYYEPTVIQNEISEPNVQSLIHQPTKFRSNTATSNNLITKCNKFCTLSNKNVEQHSNGLSSPKNIEKLVDDDTENEKDAEQNEITIELMKKNKLLTLNDLFLKLNENMLESISKCFVCNMHIDGPLKTHIFNKHEKLVLELMNESLDSSGNSSSQYFCLECQQIFSSGALLKAHIEQCECNVKGMNRASISSKNSAENDEYSKYSRDLGERKQSTMLSSFCKICNKELCNKYFMKTHMQRMHGISIQNGNHIGGVMCDICNKELCSKYFLRVHKQNSHGIVENGGCQKFWSDSENGPSDEFDNGHRYYKHYTEVCNICYRRFRSSKWLSAHLLNDHGEEGKLQWKNIQNHLEDEKSNLKSISEINTDTTTNDNMKSNSSKEQICEDMKQYRCSYCSFTTSILSFLFVHEKFHLAGSVISDELPLTCSSCNVVFQDKAQLENHYINCHFNKESDSLPVSYTISQSPENQQVVLNATNDSSPDKSLDTNGNDVFIDEPGSSIKPSRKENISLSTEKFHRMPESSHEPFIMQSFFLENCSVSPSARAESRGPSDSFHSSLVYLPVKEKLTSTVNVFFKLTPT